MLLMSDLYDGIETIEFTIVDGITRYDFPDIPRLRGKTIRRVELNKDETSFTPSGKTTVETVQNAFLTLSLREKEIIKDFPLYYLQVRDTFFYNTQLLNCSIDFPKSYITFSTLSGITSGRAFTVSVYYQDPKKEHFHNTIENVRIDYVEAIVSSTSDTEIKLSNFRNLNGKKILRISFLNPQGLTLYSPDGRTIIAVTHLRHSYLNLWDKQENIVKDFLLKRCFSIYPNHAQIYFRNLNVDWDKSFIRVGNPAVLTAGQVYYLPVFYTEK